MATRKTRIKYNASGKPRITKPRIELTPEQKAEAVFWAAEKQKWASIQHTKQRYRWNSEDATPLPSPKSKKRKPRLPGDLSLRLIPGGAQKLPVLFVYKP